VVAALADAEQSALAPVEYCLGPSPSQDTNSDLYGMLHLLPTAGTMAVAINQSECWRDRIDNHENSQLTIQCRELLARTQHEIKFI
jgi:hypothetical protein